jgi:hypothetical protein
MKKCSIYFLSLFAVFTLSAVCGVDYSNAMMGGSGSGPDGGNWQTYGPNQGMVNGTPMITNNGGFGMMNGMDATPLVDADGTAYVTSYDLVSKSKAPNSGSFESRISAINPSGQITSFTLSGITSRPVISNNTLFAAASLPDTQDFQMMGAYWTTTSQSALYAVGLPFTSASVAQAVSLDGRFASAPVVMNQKIYVVTSDYGNAVMGYQMFSAYKHYDFSNKGQAKSYLYIFNSDLTLVSKTEIQ